jgi:4'-phosphopantetheinyl transferase
MPALELGQIHLWLTYYDRIHDRTLLDKYRALLSETERAKEKRFHFEKDQHRYLITRALVRTVLSRYAPISPTAWEFVQNEHGRPELSPVIARSVELVFNISHTRGLIALGVARRGALGVDVENIAAREVTLAIARRFFAPEEADALARIPAETQRRRFFEYWTFKESYIKARGLGLALPLRQFRFQLDSRNSVRFDVDKQLGDAADRWHFWQLQPSAEHLLAVCSDSLPTGRGQLALFATVPLQSDEAMAVTPLRETGISPP